MTLRIAPPSPCSIICRPAAREQRKLPSRTIATTARQPFGDNSSALTTKLPAALFTRTSTRPNWSTAAATRASTCSGSRTSVGCPSAFPLRPSIRSTVSSSGSGRRPATTTPAPRRANSSAKARPRPLPPPVTSATFPSKVPSASIGAILPAQSAGIEGKRSVGGHQQRVDLDLAEVGTGRGEARERGYRLGRRRHVHRRSAAHAGEDRRAAERADELLCL